mmetsp:Transcript_10437/g.24204  ORF Transcript_10437/g.24204 Transcript_10437/m.24204 type:complete len:102 (-) Transcript_10437:811-1116(-)
MIRCEALWDEQGPATAARNKALAPPVPVHARYIAFPHTLFVHENCCSGCAFNEIEVSILLRFLVRRMCPQERIATHRDDNKGLLWTIPNIMTTQRGGAHIG